MNDINHIVFELYKDLLNKNQRNDTVLSSLITSIKKMYRYMISGKFFDRKNMNRKLLEMNRFVATDKVFKDAKFAIYTVNTGGYDQIYEPLYIDESIDYYIYTDQKIPENSVWKKIEINNDRLKRMSSLEQARYIKLHPHEFLKSYEYSMFIDGNVKITCDIRPLLYTMIDNNKKIAIHDHQTRDCLYDEGKVVRIWKKDTSGKAKKQIEFYKKNNFPEHFGLFETNIVIRKHNDEECIEVMNTWWKEIERFSKRDQLSFTYALWKNGFDKEFVLSLGNNSRRNPYFIVQNHK